MLVNKNPGQQEYSQQTTTEESVRLRASESTRELGQLRWGLPTAEGPEAENEIYSFVP